MNIYKYYKKRYIKLFGFPLYIMEEKKHFWSRWKLVTEEGGQIILFRLLPNGRYDAEWKYTKISG